MDATRRAAILSAYARHARRFEAIAARPRHSSGLFAEYGDAGSDQPKAAVPAARGGLSERELQVLSLLALGLSNDEIAAELELSLETKGSHAPEGDSRLEARNRSHAVYLACLQGLVA